MSSFPPFLTSILTVENILVSDSPLCYNVPIGVTILGRRLPSYRGTEPSDYIETGLRESSTKEGMDMSDFELLSLVLMILGIVIPILIAYIDAKK